MLNVAIENQNGWNYSAPAPHKTGAGRGNPMFTRAHNRAKAVFLCAKHSLIRIMVGRAGQPKGWPGSLVTGISTPVRLTTFMVVESHGGELTNLSLEAAIMATIPTLSHPDVTIENGRAVTTSVAIAEFFRKMHKDVLKKSTTWNAHRNLASAILRPPNILMSKAKNAQCTKSPKTASFSW